MPTIKVSQSDYALLREYGHRMCTLPGEKITDDQAIRKALSSAIRDLEHDLHPREYISPCEDTGR